MNDISKRVKELRLAKGMTQEELGNACGYKSGKQMISAIERGLTDIPLERLKDIAKALGVSASYLAGVETDEESKAHKEYILALFGNLNAEGRKKAQEYLQLLNKDPDLVRMDN